MGSPVIPRLLRLWFMWEGLEIFFFSLQPVFATSWMLLEGGTKGHQPCPTIPPSSGEESCAVPEITAPGGEQTAGEQNI